jgi:hypothetical protein
MKTYKKKERTLPKFNPLPTYIANLRDSFGPRQTYARFYGDYVTFKGRTRRFSFQMILPFESDGDERYFMVRSICGRLLEKEIPLHEPGQVFDFNKLLRRTQWIRIRRITEYKVGMSYD